MKERICKTCGCSSEATAFYARGLTCKQCVSTKNNNRYHALPDEQKRKYRNNVAKWQEDNIFQYRALSAKARAAKANMVYEIDGAFLEGLFTTQNGRCFYTGLEMTRTRDGKFSISVDRTDNNKGYIPSNVVLCCWFVNAMKSEFCMDEFVNTAILIADKHRLNS